MEDKDEGEESSSRDLSEDEKIAEFQNKVKRASPQKEFRFELLDFIFLT